MDACTASWIRSLADEAAAKDGCRFDLPAAERVRDFFRKFLRHSKGEWAGKPFDLLDWQWRDIIGPLFGWKRPDGTRRFRRAYVGIPKKNGKSAMASAISLYLLVADDEPGAEVYSAAADRDQAGIVFGEAANMVEASPALQSRLGVVRSTKRITYVKQKAWLKALSADVPTKEGLNIHGLIFDELHAQKQRHLWDTLTYGGASRRQPMFISITTAGYDRDTICYEQYTYAKSVLSGAIVDPSFFAYVAEADPEKDDWKDPAVWRKANPGFGVTIKADAFEADCREAINSPAKENSFKRYRLNIWTEQDVRAISMDAWRGCRSQIDPEELVGRPCYAGLDLASTMDTCALVLVFPGDDQAYIVQPYFWVPEHAAKERERTNRTRLAEWIRAGLIEQTPGAVTDYARIRRRINELSQLYDIREIAFDPWNATQLATQLKEEDGLPVIAFRQGFGSMSEPTKELLALIASGRLRHDGNPVLSWMAGNFVTRDDPAGNLKPSKDKATEKIDGIVATIMALGRALVRVSGESVYERRELLVL